MKEIKIGVSSTTPDAPVIKYIFGDISKDSLSPDYFNKLINTAYNLLHSVINDPADTQLDVYIGDTTPIYGFIAIYNAAKKLGVKTIDCCSKDKTDNVYKHQSIS